MKEARIVPGDKAKTVVVGAPKESLVRRLAREELAARERAVQILDAAKTEADALLAKARERAAHVAEAAAREAAAAEQTKLSAAVVALRAREAGIEEERLSHAVELARVLCERMLGEALRLDANIIGALARQALAEAQGAKVLRIDANPDDAEPLRRCLAHAVPAQVASVAVDATLERGSLRLHTDLGTLDAQLRPQLDRLAAALRDALR